MTSVAPGGDCPFWFAFLDRCTGGDRELVAFLARIAGLSLTGVTRDHALFFLYGQGGNGKGVYTRALCDVLDDYALPTPVATLIASNSDRHPTELARLRGARLVIASEPERDRYWNESRIKRLTGEDRIAARFMRPDLFEFDPQFKLLISANDR